LPRNTSSALDLADLSADLRRTHGVETVCCEGDLADTEFLESLAAVCLSLDLGLLVYNAAHSPIGEFCSLPPAELTRVIDVNVRAPVILVRALLPRMTARGRGGVLLMSSVAGMIGAPRVAIYSASKAFNRILAQALWYEMKGSNIDVLTCCSGAARTPGYANASDEDAPGTLDPEDVAEQALRALGHGPMMVPGRVNRLADFVLNRLMSRRLAVTIMGASTTGLVQPKTPKEPS
jgi:short-subunit dehydrogenase